MFSGSIADDDDLYCSALSVKCEIIKVKLSESPCYCPLLYIIPFRL